VLVEQSVEVAFELTDLATSDTVLIDEREQPRYSILVSDR
jgi:hypothetical protein